MATPNELYGTRFLVEKLTVSHLARNSPPVMEIWLITVFTKGCH
jgi:hypothetical protein